MMEYTVNTPDGKQLVVTPNKGEGFTVNGKSVSPEISVLEPGLLSIMLDGKSHVAEVLKFDAAQKQFTIRINGKSVQLQAADKYDILLKALGMDAGAAAKAGDLKAPMPGLVIDVVISEGMEVKKGDKLVVLEAMKMENILKAAADGKVKKVHVAKGNTVDKNAVLIQFQ